MRDCPAAVREVIDAAAPVGEPPEQPPRGERTDDGLPDDCPVKALGMSGGTRWYLDALCQLQGLTPREHSKLGILSLFCHRADFLYATWPSKDDDGKVIGWQSGKAAEKLMVGASRRGVWDPGGRSRGVGAWIGENDELIWHFGDAVLAGSTWRPCGIIGRHLYPAGAPIPRPSEVFAPAGPMGPAQELLDLIRLWNWQRPDADPELLLGLLCAQMLGGALSWRPTGFVTGDAGTGKSTLHDVFREVHGENGAIATGDATEAGLRQTIKYASLPVLVDEIEPGDDPRKATAIIGLARRASSGSISLRGSAGHVGADFIVRSTFLFSSVLLPPLTSAELSRMIILALEPLGSRSLPIFERTKLQTLGSALRRRLIDQWPRFSQVLAAYRGALIEGGHDSRGADVYGTVLACMAVVLFERDSFPPGELDFWVERLRPGVAGPEIVEPDHHKCLVHLLTATVDAFRSGTRHTIGQWIADGLDAKGGPREANQILETYGLKVVFRGKERVAGVYIATSHTGLSGIFRETHWAGGGSKTSPWTQSLRRIPGAEPGASQRFAGATIKTTWLPAGAFAPEADEGETG